MGGGGGLSRRLLAVVALLLCTAFAAALAEREADKAGTFLVASSGMLDPRFRESVILITQRNEYGSAGVIVNRPTRRTLSSAFPGNPAFENRREPLYFGGPVSFQSIFFLFRSPERPPDSIHVFRDIYLGTDLELLQERLKHDDFANRVRVFAGYAGWSPGQLEAEIARGDWHTVKADEKVLFGDVPEGLWRELIESFTGRWVRRGVGKVRAQPGPPVSPHGVADDRTGAASRTVPAPPALRSGLPPAVPGASGHGQLAVSGT